METGYYWVKYKGAWLIALYHPGYWWLCGFNRDYKITDFDEIGEYIPDHPKR